MAAMAQRRPPPALLGAAEAAQALRRGAVHRGSGAFRAMYSSVAGGIVTDPALMVVPLDDHLVHRGHAVFDTAALCRGHLYELEQHLDRFLRSARLARIPQAFPREAVREAVVATAAASGLRDGSVRYWMSAGQGGFGLSPRECVGPSLYAVAVDTAHGKAPPDASRGWRLATSAVPIKPPFFATVKSTNYLPNALCVMDAEASGADQGVFIDADGFVGEGPNMNLAIVAGGRLVVPPFESTLAGLTVQRVMQLAREAAGTAALPGVRRVEFGKFTLEEAMGAEEVMVIGSGTVVMPCVEWDGRPVGGGAPGQAALALRAMIQADMATPSPDRHIPIPYELYAS